MLAGYSGCYSEDSKNYQGIPKNTRDSRVEKLKFKIGRDFVIFEPHATDPLHVLRG